MIDSISRRLGHVEVAAHPRAHGVNCPGCGQPSVRVHSRYQRTLADAAVGGQPVRIRLAVRRFFCDDKACERRTFAEQVDGLTIRYGRRSLLLQQLLERIALALAGRPGARLTRCLGTPVSRSTLLRLVRAIPDRPAGTVAALGVDDFALRRGHNYGTIIIDATNHTPLEVLADREAATLTEWLKQQGGIEVICRDRAGAYAQAARDGAPEAIQVADRWHLWHNLAQAVDKTVASCRSEYKQALQNTNHDNDATDDEPCTNGADIAYDAADVADEHEASRQPKKLSPKKLSPKKPPEMETQLAKRTRERYWQIKSLQQEKCSIGEITRRLGLDRHTVQRFVRAGSLEEVMAKTGRRDSKLDPYKPYLCRQFNNGCTDAADLTREIKQRGYRGSEPTVRRYLAPFRRYQQAPPAASTEPAVPSCRTVTGWLTRDPDSLTEDDKTGLGKVLAASNTLTRTKEQISDFAKILTRREGHRLDEWMEDVEAAGTPPLRTFVNGLRKDKDAVINGLTLGYNSGPVEGTVNKIKMLKRQMYGRANFDLLRKRILNPV